MGVGPKPKPPVPVNFGKEYVVSLVEVVGSCSSEVLELWLLAKGKVMPRMKK